MSTKNSKIGKKGKAMIKTGTAALSVGLSECDSQTETKLTDGYKVGTKSIPALFWKKMSPINGKKVTGGKVGND